MTKVLKNDVELKSLGMNVFIPSGSSVCCIDETEDFYKVCYEMKNFWNNSDKRLQNVGVDVNFYVKKYELE